MADLYSKLLCPDTSPVLSTTCNGRLAGDFGQAACTHRAYFGVHPIHYFCGFFVEVRRRIKINAARVVDKIPDKVHDKLSGSEPRRQNPTNFKKCKAPE